MTYVTYNDSIRNRNRTTYKVEKGSNLSKEELQKVFDELRNNKFSTKEHQSNIKEYNEYKNGKLENISTEKEIEMKIFDTLIELGFSIENIGTFFYKELIMEISRTLNCKNVYGIEFCNEETIKEMLNNRYSSIYIEIAKFYLEISCDTFHNRIKDAVKEVDISKTNKDLVVEIFEGHEDAKSYQEQALYIGKYIQNKYLGKVQTKELAMA